MRQVLAFAAPLALVTALISAPRAQAQDVIAIDGFSYNGSGCAPGTASYNLAQGGQALTLLFSDFLVATDAVSTKSCAIAFRLRVPPGWQYAIFAIDTRGYADVQGNASGYHSSSYRIGGGPLNQLGVRQVTGPYVADYFHHNEITLSANNWSPCNAAGQNLDVNLQMGVNGPGRAMMTIDSVDGSLEKHFGVRWRHCPSTDMNRRFVENLYADVLGRWAGEPEIQSWYNSVARGANRNDTAMGFIKSYEHRTHEVYDAYVTLLGRLPSPQERHAQATNMVNNKITIDDFLTAVAASPEFFRRFGNTPQGFVIGMYRTVLQREPSPQEVNAWVQAASRNRAQVAGQIIKSPESRTKLVAKWYARYLKRPGSPQEWQTWANNMTSWREAQEMAQAHIIGSQEYFTSPR